MTIQTGEELNALLNKGYKEPGSTMLLVDPDKFKVAFDNKFLELAAGAASGGVRRQDEVTAEQVLSLLQDDFSYRGPGAWQYKGAKTNSDPTCDRIKEFDKIFLYYMRPKKYGGIQFGVYEADLTGRPSKPGELNSIIDELASQGRQGRRPDYVQFSDVQWRGPCYVAFLMDEDGWDYHYEDGKNFSLHFPEVLDEACPPNIVYHRNWSFFRARDIEIDLFGSKRIVLLCENHHLTVDGNNAPRSRTSEGDDPYKFDIYYRVMMNPYEASRRPVTIVIDPTGTNFGPP